MSAEQPWWRPRLIDELKTLVASAAEGEGSQNEETEILLSMQAHHQRWLEEIVEAGMSRGSCSRKVLPWGGVSDWMLRSTLPRGS